MAKAKRVALSVCVRTDGQTTVNPPHELETRRRLRRS